MLFLALAIALPSTVAAEKRPLVPEDLFRREAITEAVVSPDETSIAYVAQRALATGKQFGRNYLDGNDHADVWVVSTDGEKAINLTNGLEDDSGYWSPKWSPDGESIAMLSTKGGHVRLWVWTKASHELQMMSPLSASDWPDSFEWISNHCIVFAVLPEGVETTDAAIDRRTPEIASEEWKKAWDGKLSTASVLHSGMASTQPATKSSSQLLLGDVRTGKIEVISTTGSGSGDNSFATLRLAPDRHSIAFLRQVGTWQPYPGQAVKALISPVYEVVVASLNKSHKLRVMTGLSDIWWGSLTWSPDSTQLAVVGHDGPRDTFERVFRCKVNEGNCRPAVSEPLELGLHINMVNEPLCVWLDSEELLFWARGNGKAAESWWRTGGQRRARAFPTDCDAAPCQLVSLAAGRGLLVVKEGELFQIKEDGSRRDLCPALRGKVSAIEVSKTSEPVKGDRILLKVREAQQDILYLLNMSTGIAKELALPSEEAQLLGLGATCKTIILRADSSTGTYVWIQQTAPESRTKVFEANAFFGGIAEGELIRIKYKSLDGKELSGWVVLPIDYKKGQSYPVVVWVYPGRTYGETAPEARVRLNGRLPFNLQLLASHGFAVLLPSMPLDDSGSHDIYFHLTKGVLPAVERLIELGIADPERIGLLGHSFGGYATYGLITQTSRFRAAVALAGTSDLLSRYGTLDARRRYQSDAHEEPFQIWNAERISGVAPWMDVQRFIRNSPVMYAERVQAPVLIIQGDLDYVPMQQGEEFFTALYRQNKRADFVRYWGEDHVLESPANIKDMWARIFDWFDTFLRPAEGAAAHSAASMPGGRGVERGNRK